MVQFKNVFTGQEKRDYTRAADVAEVRARRRQAQRSRQRRLHRPASHFLRDAGQLLVRRLFQGRRDRAGVGAVTKEFGLDPKRLMVTVYHDDEEAFALWKKLTGFPIPRSSASPATTISGAWGTQVRADHARRSSMITARTIPGGPPGTTDADGDRFIEIWNLVFMQYEQRADGDRVVAAEAVDRYRHGPGAHLRRSAGHTLQLRDRSLQGADRGVRGCYRRGSDGSGESIAQGHRGPSARHELPHRRWRAALQRGARLRAPSDHATCYAARPHARGQGTADAPAGAGAGAPDG